MKGNSAAKTRQLDFALSVISAIRFEHKIYEPMDLREIAELTQEIAGDTGGGCSWQNIYRIEQGALRKLRNALVFRKNKDLRELLDHYQQRKAA